MPLDVTRPLDTASNSTLRASPLPACAGGVSYARLTVAGLTDAGEVSLLTADRQCFSLPASLLPGKLSSETTVMTATGKVVRMEEETASLAFWYEG